MELIVPQPAWDVLIFHSQTDFLNIFINWH